ncbi:YihY family inner membrane protein [Halomonas shantousis]
MQWPQLPRIAWLQGPFHVARILMRRFNEHDGFRTASALTYTTLFAVVPFMTVLYAMLSGIPSFQGVSEQIQSLIFEQFVPATGSTVLEYLRDFSNQARSLTSVGLLFLFVTSVLMMVTVEHAFNVIWKVRHSRRGLASFLLYWTVLTLGPLLVGSGFLLSSYLASLGVFQGAASLFGSLVSVLRLLPLLLSFIAFVFIYMAVPNCRVRLRHALIGGAMASLALELARAGFSLYVSSFPTYQVIYGTFATVPLFLLWVFLLWSIVLLGAELTAWLGERHQASWQQWPDFWQAMGILVMLRDAHTAGVPLRDKTLISRLGSHYHLIMEPLASIGVATQTGSGDWVLSRDLDSITLWEATRSLPWTAELDHVPLPRLQPLYEVLVEGCERQRQATQIPLGALIVGSKSVK